MLEEIAGIKIIFHYKPLNKKLYFRLKPNEIHIYGPKIKDELIVRFYNENQKVIEKYCNVKREEGTFLHLYGNKYEVVLKKDYFDVVELNSNKMTIYYTNKNNINKTIKRYYEHFVKGQVNLIYEEIKSEIKGTTLEKVLAKKFKGFSFVYRKSFLGRCNYKTGIVEISTYLAKFNFSFIKGIIYHEFVHFLEQNHGDMFHKYLDYYYPNNKIDRKLMKKTLIEANHDLI